MARNNNFIKGLNLQDGIIAYDDFDIDESVPFEEQIFSYKEDILQITFGERFLLDVGWYPEMDPAGKFRVRAIQDYNWQNPVSKIDCRTLDQLKKAIEETAKIISSKRKSSNPIE